MATSSRGIMASSDSGDHREGNDKNKKFQSPDKQVMELKKKVHQKKRWDAFVAYRRRKKLEEVDPTNFDDETGPSSCDEEEVGLEDKDYEEMEDVSEDDSREFVPKIDRVLLTQDTKKYPSHYLSSRSQLINQRVNQLIRVGQMVKLKLVDVNSPYDFLMDFDLPKGGEWEQDLQKFYNKKENNFLYQLKTRVRKGGYYAALSPHSQHWYRVRVNDTFESSLSTAVWLIDYTDSMRVPVINLRELDTQFTMPMLGMLWGFLTNIKPVSHSEESANTTWPTEVAKSFQNMTLNKSFNALVVSKQSLPLEVHRIRQVQEFDKRQLRLGLILREDESQKTLQQILIDMGFAVEHESLGPNGRPTRLLINTD